jgi:hypothetical protein
MPASCTVCSLSRLADLNRALDAGGGVNATARAFGVSPSALKRHLQHRAPPPEVPPPVPSEPVLPTATLGAPTVGLLARLRALEKSADQLFKEGNVAKDVSLKDRGVIMGEARKTLQAMHQIAAEISKTANLRLVESADWAELQTFLLDALEPYPEASAAVVAAIEEHERRHPPAAGEA